MKTKILSTIIVSALLAAGTAFGQGAANRGDVTPDERPAPGFVQELREGIHSVREALQGSRAEMLDSLDGATVEERRAAIAAWREANADQIAQLREMTAEIREVVGDFRERRMERRERPELPEVAQDRQGLRENTESMREARQNLGQTMRESSLTPEERQAEIEAFRSQQQALIEERKEIRREMRERNANANAAGGRRVTD
ncbi:MAG: hypothetical protein JJU20_01675 [Opitutales bacterium]|nr:hypothetical protein [Opitutales bacterium]